MKAVLISIKPEWCEKIANGEKTIEIRKSKPKLATPFKVYIYCTKDVRKQLYQSPSGFYCNNHISTESFNGKVIGEFVCDRIITDATYGHNTVLNTLACLTPADAASYCVNPEMYGWHISELEIYDTPKELSEYLVEDNKTFDCPGLTTMKRPPQSWCYVEGERKET